MTDLSRRGILPAEFVPISWAGEEVIPADRLTAEQKRLLADNIGLASRPLVVFGMDPASHDGDNSCTMIFERQPDGSMRVIDFITSNWDRRRQKRWDRGIKHKAPPSRGWARHIRKQKARRK